MAVSVDARVTRTVNVDEVIGGATRKFLNRAMLAIHQSASQPGIVPIDTGLLRSSLAPGGGVTMVDPASPPTWARVGTSVAYGSALNDPETRTPHYRGGPSSGQETQGWLTERAVQGAESDIQAAAEQWAGDVEVGWKAGG